MERCLEPRQCGRVRGERPAHTLGDRERLPALAVRVVDPSLSERQRGELGQHPALPPGHPDGLRELRALPEPVERACVVSLVPVDRADRPRRLGVAPRSLEPVVVPRVNSVARLDELARARGRGGSSR